MSPMGEPFFGNGAGSDGLALWFAQADSNHDGSNIPEPVMSADGDFNRGVSLEEFRRAATKRFQLLDLNHSGRLTLPVLLTDAEAAADQAKRPLGYKPPEVQLDPQADTEGATPQ
jgi:hypothetical protein